MTTHPTRSSTALTRGSPRKPTTDHGAIQVGAVIAAAVAGLLLIPLLFGAALLGTNNSTSTQSDCGQQPAAQPGAATTAVTDIPALYLRLYQQTGQHYGVPWNLLAAIGKIESDHGRDPGAGVKSGANSAGAAGPMQIGIGGQAGNTWGGAPRHPATEQTGGVSVDGDGDGWADVYDPADAIPGAARYLLEHGAPSNLNEAVFAYNHDNTYVHQVLAQAAQYATGNIQPVTDTNPAACPGDITAFAAMPGGVAAKVLAYARAQLGKPYVYGGVGPDSFDCSGLTMMAYKAAGITIPRLANYQYFNEPKITPGHEQPGDLVFFPGSDGTPTDPGHVGIVTNPTTGTMVVAPHTGTDIQIQSYKNYPGGPVGFTRPAAKTPPPTTNGGAAQQAHGWVSVSQWAIPPSLNSTRWDSGWAESAADGNNEPYMSGLLALGVSRTNPTRYCWLSRAAHKPQIVAPGGGLTPWTKSGNGGQYR